MLQSSLKGKRITLTPSVNRTQPFRTSVWRSPTKLTRPTCCASSGLLSMSWMSFRCVYIHVYTLAVGSFVASCTVMAMSHLAFVPLRFDLISSLLAFSAFFNSRSPSLCHTSSFVLISSYRRSPTGPSHPQTSPSSGHHALTPKRVS